MKESDLLIRDFLHWMSKNNIDGVIPFIVMMGGKNPKIPHWTNGKELYNSGDLVKMYNASLREKNAADKTDRNSHH